MKTTYRLLAHCVSWALSFNAIPLTSIVMVAETASQPARAAELPANKLEIRQPAADRFDGDDVPLRLRLGSDVAVDTVDVFLNGRPIDTTRLVRDFDDCTDRRIPVTLRGAHSDQLQSPGICDDRAHRMILSATMTSFDGLKPGHNHLRVAALNDDGSADATVADFYYAPPVVGMGASEVQRYLPNSVGLTVSSGGADPWVHINTGWPQLATPDPDTNLLPYYDATFPSTTDTACAASDVYQVLVLDRSEPTAEIDYRCFGTDGALSAYLGTLTNEELVIAGTTWGHNAGTTLNTSKIGGQSHAASEDVQGYVVIGVGGATPNTAYESYYTTEDPASFDVVGGSPVDMNPHAAGTLNFDINGHYSFVSGEAQPFIVSPGDPASVTIGSTSYSSSSAQGSDHDGFYLLVVDRLTLAPVDSWYGDANALCRVAGFPTPTFCGVFYPTNTSTQAMTDLANALNAVTPREIAILTSVGTPLPIPAVGNDLANAIKRLGGTYYTLPNLASPGATFTLVADGPDPATTAATGGNSMDLTKGVVESTSAFTQQHETGNISGLFARDAAGLYYAQSASQEDGLPTTMDYTFHTVSTAPTGDWPMTDTPGHVAAYHAISHAYLGSSPLNLSGMLSYDLRYHYASNTDKVEIAFGWFGADGATCPQGMAGSNYSATEYCDVWTQLRSEILVLSSTRSLLDDAGGLRDIFTQNIAPDVVSASYTVGKGQFGTTPAGTLDENISEWLKMAVIATSFGSVVAGPVRPLFNLASAILNVGAAASAMAANPKDPAQFESKYDVSLGSTAGYSDFFVKNIPIAYDTATNMIYSDWSKLQQIGEKIKDTDNGWAIESPIEGDAISFAMATGAQRALYLQLLPQYYSIDFNTTVPVFDIKNLGSFKYQTCTENYPNVVDEGYSRYSSVGTFGTNGSNAVVDFLVLGGALDNNNATGMEESMPSQQLLDDLFADPETVSSTIAYPLNFAKDVIFSSNGPVPARSSVPKYNGQYCYLIGCTWNGNTNGPGSCTGPVNGQ
jgi:hypothetical protein